METIGLRELNQNPSQAVARVRAGASVVVTDRGVPVMRMTPEAEHPGTLERMIQSGEVHAPTQQAMPDVIPELADEQRSYTDMLIADRERERRR